MYVSAYPVTTKGSLHVRAGSVPNKTGWILQVVDFDLVVQIKKAFAARYDCAVSSYSVQVLHACSLHREHAVQEVGILLLQAKSPATLFCYLVYTYMLLLSLPHYSLHIVRGREEAGECPRHLHPTPTRSRSYCL